MLHHSSEDYNVAASRAANLARDRFQDIIERGKASAMQVLEQVQTQVPVDRISHAHRLTVKGENDGYELIIPGVEPQKLHEHALRQVAERVGFHGQYLSNLRKLVTENEEDWAQELINRNFQELLVHARSRNLIRSVNGEVRGFLSDAFRRLDSRPLLDAFMGACTQLGAVPMEGYGLDTKVRMRAVLPHIFEPVDNEVMLFGVEWGNSDFGAGGHCLKLFNVRVWCTNTALTDEVLRQVHLGKRLDDNITYSNHTYELDNKANASALRDVVADALSPVKVNGYLELIKEAAEQKVGEKDVTRILKAKLGKGDAEKVEDLFNSPDVVNLPPGNSIYRLSNAISFFSQGKDIAPDKKLDLQKIAGDLLPSARVKAREV